MFRIFSIMYSVLVLHTKLDLANTYNLGAVGHDQAYQPFSGLLVAVTFIILRNKWTDT